MAEEKEKPKKPSKPKKKVKSLQELPPLAEMPPLKDGDPLPDDKAPLGDLPGIPQEPGIAQTKLGDVEACIRKYERKKEARCAASPDEIAAKKELAKALHVNSDKLAINDDGNRFYRMDGVDYILEEKLKRRGADDGSDED